MPSTRTIAHDASKIRRIRHAAAPNGRRVHESLAVSIEGGETTVKLGASATLHGTTETPLRDAVFTWYINGVAVGSGIREIAIAGEIVGRYRVDLLVVTQDGCDGGMSTTWVRAIA